MSKPLPEGWKEINIHDYIVRHNIPAPHVDPESLADAYANMVVADSIEEAANMIVEMDKEQEEK